MPEPPVQDAPSKVQTAGDPPPASDWRTTFIPEELRDSPHLKDFKTPQDVVKSYVSQAELIGKKDAELKKKLDGYVKVPGEKSTPEEIAAFRKALGVPSDTAGYTFEVPEDLKPLVPKEALDHWSAVFHREGVPAGMAQKLVSVWAADAAQQKVSLHQTFLAEQDKIRDGMGQITYDRYMAMADQGFKFLGKQLGEEKDAQLKALFNETLLGDHPLMIEVFHLIGQQLAEDGHVPVEPAGGAQVDAAKDRILLYIQGKASADYTEEKRHADNELIRMFDKDWDWKEHLPG